MDGDAPEVVGDRATRTAWSWVAVTALVLSVLIWVTFVSLLTADDWIRRRTSTGFEDFLALMAIALVPVSVLMAIVGIAQTTATDARRGRVFAVLALVVILPIAVILVWALIVYEPTYD